MLSSHASIKKQGLDKRKCYLFFFFTVSYYYSTLWFFIAFIQLTQVRIDENMEVKEGHVES